MRISFILTLILILVGCKPKEQTRKNYTQEEMSQIILEYNKRLNEQVQQEIQTFILADSVHVYEDAGSGIYFTVLQSGTQEVAEKAKAFSVEIAYYTLLGHQIAEAYPAKIETFAKGKHALKAVNILVERMHVDEQVQMLVPPQMGFGNDGDRNQIPPARPFLIRLKLLEAQ